jgi:hypothetical protein
MLSNMRRALTLIIFLTAGYHAATAQLVTPEGKYKLLATIVNGDTVPLVNMAPVDVYGELSPEAAANLKAYLKLRRDVLRAYPYAKLAAIELKFINDSIANIPNEKKRKQFIKIREKQMKADFEKDLRKLTLTQGRILIKLVDRETGNTGYALVKDLRGSLQAFFWQGLAKLFGSNLKSQYDAEGEDVQIENIVRQIERGELQVQAIRK